MRKVAGLCGALAIAGCTLGEKDHTQSVEPSVLQLEPSVSEAALIPLNEDHPFVMTASVIDERAKHSMRKCYERYVWLEVMDASGKPAKHAFSHVNPGDPDPTPVKESLTVELTISRPTGDGLVLSGRGDVYSGFSVRRGYNYLVSVGSLVWTGNIVAFGRVNPGCFGSMSNDARLKTESGTLVGWAGSFVASDLLDENHLMRRGGSINDGRNPAPSHQEHEGQQHDSDFSGTGG